MAVDTVDPAEVAKFEAMAAEWWDPNGKFKPLHMLNPCRLDYITSQIAAEFGRDLAVPRPFADQLRSSRTATTAERMKGRTTSPAATTMQLVSTTA